MKNFIITGCKEMATNLFPCIKQQVYAMVVTKKGFYFGANWMLNNTLTVCPRVTAGCPSGTGYELCEEVCGQGTEYHAERNAMKVVLEAGDTLEGAVLYLTGHTYCCDSCIAAMTKAGVKTAIVLDSNKIYNF